MVQILLTTVACHFCSVGCSREAKIVNNLSFYHFDCGYDGHRFLKHVSKSYDIFRVVCNCHEGVVCLI